MEESSPSEDEDDAEVDFSQPPTYDLSDEEDIEDLDQDVLRGKQILVTEEAIEEIIHLLPKSDQPDGYQKAEENIRFMRFDWDAVKRTIAIDPTVPWVMEEKNENGYDKTTDGKEAAILSANDFLNQQCVSYEEAYQCYVRYAKCVGFGVRKGDAAADSIGNYVRRKFLCNRAGVREKKCYATTSKIRKQKPETRTNCNAMLSIYLDKSCSMWKVRKIVEDHNHPLILLKLVHQISNYCTMIDADKAQVDSMHRHGLPPSKIMGLIAGQAGGYEFAKDLDNYIERNLRSKIIEGDVNATLNYLHGKAEDEPIMIVRHSLTDDDKLEHLFWADDLSQFDYQYFGDVLAFDST
ncbi:protein FAR1-RELATED SEQUENCE 5-like [Arachis hypogaea]|uniref:protein FAR1-RELATED SEQUENCE 5-like n=1 Tax=Arachis hypogaea TaxID=3818 RepID=UPI000DECD99B|nr:protein FAR1-RELATED SEQUENCE 5-like [Arachis hypogaea]